jgi:serine/threonine-protein kinase
MDGPPVPSRADHPTGVPGRPRSLLDSTVNPDDTPTDTTRAARTPDPADLDDTLCIDDEAATIPLIARSAPPTDISIVQRDELAGRTTAESMLIRLCISRGLATVEEITECLDLQRADEGAEGSPSAPPLGEFLVAHGSITRRQLDRLAGEVEAKSATQQLPGFRVHRIVGRGASGTVLKATQISLDRPVAIKVLPRRLSADAHAVAALYAEGRAAASLNHHNIVRAYDVQQAGDCHFFVMEFVEGQTVADVLREKGPYAEEPALDIIIAIADALAHAHAQGLIHRDVKPRNIILTAAGVPKLADLGLARVIADADAARAERGRALGTPLYIAPEQIRGEESIGPPADIYALGATFYHMVTGKPPFQAADRDQVFQMHLSTPALPPVDLAPDLTVGLSEVIEKMLAKKVEDRYRSCTDLLDELRAWKALCVLRRGERSGGPKP